MAFTGNTIGTVVHGPLALVQRLKEELATEKLRGATSTVIAACIDKLDQAASTLEAFRVKEEAIAVDANLSDQGKRTKMEALSKEFSGQLAFIGQAATDRTQAANELRKELDTLPTITTDPILSYLREAEVRRRLERLTHVERMKFMGDATKPQRTMILSAVEHDPLNPDLLIPAEYRQRIKDELLEKSRAEELERWRALTFVSEKLQLLANTLDVSLGKYRIDVPTFPTQPIDKVDLKMKDQTTPATKSSAADQSPAGVSSFQ